MTKPFQIQLLPSSHAFTQDLTESSRDIQKSLWVQTLSFEADEGGGYLFDLFQSLDVDKRLLLDQFYHVIMSDQFIYAPKNRHNDALKREIYETKQALQQLSQQGTAIKEVNPLGFLLRKIARRDHKKIITLDDHTAYIGGINFSAHNFLWHDFMLKIEDPDCVQALKNDFNLTWQGQKKPYILKQSAWTLLSTFGNHNKKYNNYLLKLIKQAKKQIKVHTPYLSSPFIDDLYALAEQGVRIDLITNQQSNWPLYNHYIQSYATHKNFHIHYYQPNFTHCKAMVIDDEMIILGSSNFDYSSFYSHSEIVLVTQAVHLIQSFNDVIWQPDLEQCLTGVYEAPSLKLTLARKKYNAILKMARFISL